MPAQHTLPLIEAARELSAAVSGLSFGPPVAYVYNPLDYAWAGHAAYLERYGAGPKRVVFFGMNPGPFGMAQTGVPFGVTDAVRDFLGLDPRIGRPQREHPKRPVLGMACPRREVSGARLWGAVADHFGTAERFFAEHLVANYCPLAFLDPGGRNLTPDKLPAAEREPLFAACDRHLRRVVETLRPEWVVGIGGFAHERAHEALRSGRVKLGRITHPSPANPRASKNWAQTARRELEALGLCASAGRPAAAPGSRASRRAPGASPKAPDTPL
jgi:single-strand selective monofunctional uracil DNA glycosylase